MNRYQMHYCWFVCLLYALLCVHNILTKKGNFFQLLKRLAQAKIIKKSVILFQVLNMTI